MNIIGILVLILGYAIIGGIEYNSLTGWPLFFSVCCYLGVFAVWGMFQCQNKNK